MGTTREGRGEFRSDYIPAIYPEHAVTRDVGEGGGGQGEKGRGRGGGGEGVDCPHTNFHPTRALLLT